MGYNEMCAYLHAEITNTDGDGLNLYYDDHYCAYFEKNPSYWTLELSDSFRKKTGGDARVSVDGKTIDAVLGPEQKVEIPAGTGTHIIKLFVKIK